MSKGLPPQKSIQSKAKAGPAAKKNQQGLTNFFSKKAPAKAKVGAAVAICRCRPRPWPLPRCRRAAAAAADSFVAATGVGKIVGRWVVLQVERVPDKKPAKVESRSESEDDDEDEGVQRRHKRRHVVHDSSDESDGDEDVREQELALQQAMADEQDSNETSVSADQGQSETAEEEAAEAAVAADAVSTVPDTAATAVTKIKKTRTFINAKGCIGKRAFPLYTHRNNHTNTPFKHHAMHDITDYMRALPAHRG